MTGFEYKPNFPERIGKSPGVTISNGSNSQRLSDEAPSLIWLVLLQMVGAFTALVTVASALLALIIVIVLLIAGPGNEQWIAFFSLTGAILWALVYRLVTLALRRGAERPAPASVTVGAFVFIFAIILLLLGRGNELTIVGLSLIGAIVWVVIFDLIMKRLRPKPAPTPPPAAYSDTVVRSFSMTISNPLIQSSSPEQIAMNREPLLRRTVVAIAGTLALLGGVILLIKYNHIYAFLAAASLTLPFPFSYLAYAAFQSNLRVQRLKRDFLLMQAPWNEEHYNQAQGFWHFALHIALAVLVTLVGITVFFLSFDLNPPIKNFVTDLALQALRFGFLGGYLFSLGWVYRRYTTHDLLPSVYLYCAATMLSGLAFNYVAFQAISMIGKASTDTVSGNALVDLLAFALGFFPLLAVQWISRVAYTALGERTRRADELPLSLIDGISTFHDTRLHDQGIDNVQNLATIDIPTLLIDTTFEAQEVIDWVDQATLYLYLTPDEISGFRRGKIRSVSDFRDWWAKAHKDKDTVDNALKQSGGIGENQPTPVDLEKIALQVQSTPDELDALFLSTQAGPNFNYIMNYWRNTDMDAIEFFQFRYNQILGDAILLSNSDDDKRALQDKHDLIEKLISAALPEKLIASSGYSLAGLARLNLNLVDFASPNDSDVETAIRSYAEALNFNDRVVKQAIKDLKSLTDAKMKIVESKVVQAKAATSPEKKTLLEQAVSLAETTMEMSRLCYKDNSANVSYQCRLADLKRQMSKIEQDENKRLDLENEALTLYCDAREHAEKIKNYDADQLKIIGDIIREIEAEQTASPSGNVTTPSIATSTSPVTIASATITKPADNERVIGNSIKVEGTAEGILSNEITLIMKKPNGTNADSQVIALTGAEHNAVSWTQTLTTGGYLGGAEICVLATNNGQQTTLASINITLQ